MSLLSNGPNCAHQVMFRFLRALLFLFAIACPISSVAAGTPPIEENAYCGIGDVAKFGQKDGPAQLPSSCYYTGMDGTPSPGKQIRLGAGSDLSGAINSAKCGDTILLAAGTSFDIKDLPAKKCDDRHYVTIRTDTPDSKLPPEGARISPAWAGVASLPGRPSYSQPSGGPAKLMATLVVKSPSGVTLGDHYRFIGLEWVGEPNPHSTRLATTEGADHIIFDRNWIHPAEGVEMRNGIRMIHGTRFIAVINSYLGGFYCVARSGACTDASALGGGNGDLPISTLKIYNNFIEAAGENILFGGAASEVNPTDIEIRRNHLFKPMLWKEGEPGYAPAASGNPVVVKNHFELKSGIRVLFEANLMENCWGDFCAISTAWPVMTDLVDASPAALRRVAWPCSCMKATPWTFDTRNYRDQAARLMPSCRWASMVRRYSHSDRETETRARNALRPAAEAHGVPRLVSGTFAARMFEAAGSRVARRSRLCPRPECDSRTDWYCSRRNLFVGLLLDAAIAPLCGPGLVERVGILHGKDHFHPPAPVDHSPALDDVQLLGMRRAVDVDHRLVVQADGVDDERVALGDRPTYNSASGVRRAVDVDHRLVVQADGVDDERVALVMADQLAVP